MDRYCKQVVYSRVACAERMLHYSDTLAVSLSAPRKLPCADSKLTHIQKPNTHSVRQGKKPSSLITHCSLFALLSWTHTCPHALARGYTQSPTDFALVSFAHAQYTLTDAANSVHRLSSLIQIQYRGAYEQSLIRRAHAQGSHSPMHAHQPTWGKSNSFG